MPIITIYGLQKAQRKQGNEVAATQLDDLDSSDHSEGDSLDEGIVESMISIEEANRLTVGQRYSTGLAEGRRSLELDLRLYSSA